MKKPFAVALLPCLALLPLAGCDSSGDDAAVSLRGVRPGGTYRAPVRVEVVVSDPGVYWSGRLTLQADTLYGEWADDVHPYVFEAFPFDERFVQAGYVDVTPRAFITRNGRIEVDSGEPVRVFFEQP